MRGLWFVRGNLVRELTSLNKMELLPWDLWGLVDIGNEQLSEDDWQFLDHIAACLLDDHSAFPEIRSIYEEDERVRPTVVKLPEYFGGQATTL